MLSYSKVFIDEFQKKARYHNGEYLIEHGGDVLIAKTPKELIEKYRQIKLKELFPIRSIKKP